MIDPEEFAEYEAWREHKLTTSQDLSVSAFNTEMESTALAWEAGVRAFADFVSRERTEARITTIDLAEVIAQNPYRGPGMRGERRRVTGVPSPTGDDDE